MGKVSQDDRDTLEVLHQQEIDGTIKPEHLEVLKRARSLGRARDLTMPDKIMRLVKTPTSKIVGTAGAEILGENLGGAAATALGPGKFAKGGKFLAQLAGITAGNVAGQAVTGGSQEEIDPEQTAIATGFGGAGIKASDGVTWLRNKFRPNKPTIDKVEGTNQLESSAALRSANRLIDAGIAPKVAHVIKNQAAEVLDAVASSSPFSKGKMRAQSESIQKFYDEAIDGFSSHYVDNVSKGQTGNMLKELLENDVNFANRTRTRNYQALDELTENTNMVDLSFMHKGDVSFEEAGKILETASDYDFKQIRKSMRKAVDDAVEAHPNDVSIDIGKMKEIKGAASEANIKWAEEFNRVGGDKAELSRNLKSKIDTALMFSNKKMRKMKSSFVEEVARKKPGVIVDAFLESKSPDTLKEAMKIMSRPLKHKIQSLFLGKVGGDGTGGLFYRSSIRAKDGSLILDGAKLLDEIAKFERGNNGAMGRALFPIHGLKGLKMLAEELAAITGKEGTGSGGTAIFLMTPGAFLAVSSAAAGLATGAGTESFSTGLATSVGVLVLPKLAARKFNDLKFVTGLVRGIRKFGNDENKLQKFLILTVTQLIAEGINATFTPGDPNRKPQEAHIGGSSSFTN